MTDFGLRNSCAFHETEILKFIGNAYLTVKMLEIVYMFDPTLPVRRRAQLLTRGIKTQDDSDI